MDEKAKEPVTEATNLAQVNTVIKEFVHVLGLEGLEYRQDKDTGDPFVVFTRYVRPHSVTLEKHEATLKDLQTKLDVLAAAVDIKVELRAAGEAHFVARPLSAKGSYNDDACACPSICPDCGKSFHVEHRKAR